MNDPPNNEKENKIIEGKIAEIPQTIDHFQLIGNYEKNSIYWSASGTLHTDINDAIKDKKIYTYIDWKIIKIKIPIPTQQSKE